MTSLLDTPPPPPRKAAGRVHRLGDDPEERGDVDDRGHTKPRITPFLAGDAKGDLITAKGTTMPTGIYDRSKAKKRTKKEKAPGAEPTAAKPRRALKAEAAKGARSKRPARAQGGGAATFGYFSDGSLVVDAAECKGKLSPADLTALRDFTKRFEADA